jgi:hypothetical protein
MTAIQIGDIVKHHKLQSRVGVVIAIDKQTIVVDWFNNNDSFVTYRYYPYALIKVSQ